MTTSPDTVLDFWFGTLDEDGLAAPETQKRWWKKDAAFDQEIRDTFMSTYEAMGSDAQAEWLSTTPGTLASVIVLDQFSRNMFRNDAQMYAKDELCQRLVLDGLDAHMDMGLSGHQRLFFYMPLMHAEKRVHQNRCVSLFEEMLRTATPTQKEALKGNLDYAIKHRDIVERFGRFPHRNDILGRASTDEEVAFLKEPGSSF